MFSELILKSQALPESTETLVCSFSSEVDAINTVILARRSGLALAKAEFLDSLSMKSFNKFSDISIQMPEAPTMFFELHGNSEGVRVDLETLKYLCYENSVKSMLPSETEEQKQNLWKVRHSALYSILQLKPQSKAFVTDICVPISKLAKIICRNQRRS